MIAVQTSHFRLAVQCGFLPLALGLGSFVENNFANGYFRRGLRGVLIDELARTLGVALALVIVLTTVAVLLIMMSQRLAGKWSRPATERLFSVSGFWLLLVGGIGVTSYWHMALNWQFPMPWSSRLSLWCRPSLS